jgi:hypothetical protein
VLHFNTARLPETWTVYSGDDYGTVLLADVDHRAAGSPDQTVFPWSEPSAPGALQVRWDGDRAALWTVNAEDPSMLPLPKQFESLTAEDILWYLASARPSHGIREIVRKLSSADVDDGDEAISPDLDPLRRYNLATTFLHRVRARARLFASVCARLSAPAWSEQALMWRLRGPLGAGEVLRRLNNELCGANGRTEETVLTIADFLLMLDDVQYVEKEGHLPRQRFEAIFSEFKSKMYEGASEAVRDLTLADDIRTFLNGILSRNTETRNV